MNFGPVFIPNSEKTRSDKGFNGAPSPVSCQCPGLLRNHRPLCVGLRSPGGENAQECSDDRSVAGSFQSINLSRYNVTPRGVTGGDGRSKRDGLADGVRVSIPPRPEP